MLSWISIYIYLPCYLQKKEHWRHVVGKLLCTWCAFFKGRSVRSGRSSENWEREEIRERKGKELTHKSHQPQKMGNPHTSLLSLPKIQSRAKRNVVFFPSSGSITSFSPTLFNYGKEGREKSFFFYRILGFSFSHTKEESKGWFIPGTQPTTHS